jgi:hypothetical protein
MSKDQQPVLNTDGTHVYVENESSGDEWECPIDYLPVALAHGFKLTAPRDRSLDGLFDESSAEGAGQTGFDPAKETVKAVNEHLEKHLSSPGEIARVLGLEEAGQNRPGVKDPRLVDVDLNPGD